MTPVMGKKPAIVGTIEVEQGQVVSGGTTLANVETGKGNRPVKAPGPGRITELLIREGDEVTSGQDLFEFEELSEADVPREPMSADLFILGGGPGGYVAALYAAKFGQKVILAEKDLLGGTCLNRGCIPTKALIQSANTCRMVREASRFGVQTASPVLDMAQVQSRKEQICSDLRSGVESLLSGAGVQILGGEASFRAPGTAQVKLPDGGVQVVDFRKAILATGSVPAPAPFPVSGARLLDSTDALELKDLPRSMAIIGGGVIGMEFAFLYSAMGVEIYVIEFLDHIMGQTDGDAEALILKEAGEQGIRIYTGSRVTEVLGTDSGQSIVTFEKDGQTHRIACETVLSATGRKVSTDGLGLDTVGVETDRRGFVVIDDSMRTTGADIYAIGDVTGKLMLAHTASRQGIAAVDAILGRKRHVDYAQIPNVIFTAPEVACVGRTEAACRAAGMDVKVSTFPFSANGKAQIMGEGVGFVKLVCDARTQKLLGGVIVGPDASALISTVTAALSAGLTAQALSDVIFAHPTTSEAIQESALGLGVGMLHFHS